LANQLHKLGIPYVVGINSDDQVLEEAAKRFNSDFLLKILEGDFIENSFIYTKRLLEIWSKQ